MKKKKIRLFDVLKESLEEAEQFYKGKLTLKTYELNIQEPRQYTAEEILNLRNKLKYSQAVFAHLCNVSTRTVQSWEQGLRTPTGATLRLLEIFDVNPEIINQQGIVYKYG